MPEPSAVTVLESKLNFLNESIQSHEAVLKSYYPNIDNKAIQEKVNWLWEARFYAKKALQFELLLNR